MAISNGPRARIAECPICGKATKTAHRPFCSQRCADVDLHRWLGEQYRMETPEQPGSVSDEDDER